MPGSPYRTFDRRTLTAFGIATAIMLGVALFTNRRQAALETATAWVEHTHQVVEALGAVRLKHALTESAARGWLVTRDPDSRRRTDESSVAVGGALRRLRALTVDNAQQQRRLDTLETLSAEVLASLHAELSEAAGAAPSMALVARSNALTRALNEEASRVERSERTLLARRTEERTAQVDRLTLGLRLGVLAALGIALLGVLRLRRLMLDRHHVEQQRDATAEALAQQSGELQERNAELLSQREALQGATGLAEEANQAKSLFLAQMSHELRTPLNSVIGFANIVRRNPRGALVASELTYLDRIVENGRHLLRIINSILDLSKIEARQETVEMELVSLDELAREVLGFLEPQAAAGALRLRLEAPSPLAMVVTDKEKLQRVLINLVANAVKFTKPGGTVSVRIETTERDRTSATAIAVHDTGIGIAPHRLTAIFDAFEQGDVGVAREYGGTGLGLSISRALCRLLRYDLTVTSELGAGSVFRVVLSPPTASIR